MTMWFWSCNTIIVCMTLWACDQNEWDVFSVVNFGWIVVGYVLVGKIDWVSCDEWCCVSILNVVGLNVILQQLHNDPWCWMIVSMSYFVLYEFWIHLGSNVVVMIPVARNHVETSPFGKVGISLGGVKNRTFWEACTCNNGSWWVLDWNHTGCDLCLQCWKECIGCETVYVCLLNLELMNYVKVRISRMLLKIPMLRYVIGFFLVWWMVCR